MYAVTVKVFPGTLPQLTVAFVMVRELEFECIMAVFWAPQIEEVCEFADGAEKANPESVVSRNPLKD